MSWGRNWHNSVDPPCTADCPDRHYKCHFEGECKRWMEFLEKQAAVRKARYNQVEIDNALLEGERRRKRKK